MGILDESTTLSWAELDATYAQKPDNEARAVGQGELVLNVRDYGAVGDGTTDDATAIQAAIDAATTTTCKAAVVWLPYTPNGYAAGSLNVFTGVTLRGERRVAIRKIGASGSLFIGMYGPRSGLENLTIDANGLATTRAVFITPGSASVTIRSCTFTDTAGLSNVRGIENAAGVADLKIQENLFDGIDNPIFINKDPQRVDISGNRIRHWRTRGIYVLGTSTQAATDLNILNNYISDPVPNSAAPRHPIQIEGDDAMKHRRVRVNFNTVIGPGKAWTASDAGTADQISLHRCTDFEVIGNISRDGGDVGITIARQCSRGVVTNNHCEFNDVTGICIGSASDTGSDSIVVANNILMNNGQNHNSDRAIQSRSGLYAYNATNLSVVANTFGDDQGSKTQQYGVSIWKSTSVKFSGNTFSGLAVGQFYNGGGNSGLDFGVTLGPVIKTVDSKVRHSARRARDPHLTTAVEARGVYLVEAFLIYRSSATADMSISWAAPSGARMNWVADGPRLSTGSPSTTVARDALVVASSTPLGGTATDMVATPRGILRVGATAGALTLLWAQAKAEASDSIMRAGSYILVTRVG